MTNLPSLLAQTPDERGALQRMQSNRAEFDEIKQTHDKFNAATKGIENSAIDAANFARQLGIHLMVLCAHEQIKFDFWQKHCEGKLPFSYDNAKMFVAIAKKMPEPATNLTEAIHLVQMALLAGNLLAEPERTESQTANTIPLLQRFVNEFTTIRQQFTKITRDEPMEKWELKRLRLFLSETEWFWKEREKAQQLAQQKEKQ